ncbi:membrane protein [Luteimicrobium subarcticum]|uniref:Membrane protein n=1 Tax=Luteimicrobium subarcticum TaxID=620910 RepID=A0A2M8WUI7_9MICO|nr:membrane protein [Luteimicrobium subarcticum]
MAGERPGLLPEGAGTRTWRESAHDLGQALGGHRGSPAPPSWVPGAVPRPVARLVGAAIQRGSATFDWWKATRGARALARFNLSRGGLLCGGLAYTALFALFAGLAIGYTGFMAVLGGNERLRDSLLDQINTAIPGLIDTGDGDGAIKPDQLLLSASSLAGVIAVLVLLWSALSFMSALRGAVRTMLGLQQQPVNFVIGKLWDLGGFVVLLVALLASTAAGIMATAAAGWFVRTLSLPDDVTTLFTIGGLVVAGLVDVLVVLYVLRVLGGSRAGWADTLRAAVTAAVVLGVLRFLGTSLVVGSASKNALLAGFAALVTILLLVNFVARVLLLVAAWLADPPASDVYPAPHDDERERAPRTHARRASASALEPEHYRTAAVRTRPARAATAATRPARARTAGPRPETSGEDRPSRSRWSRWFRRRA